jgi:hypothetical protein
MKPPNWKFEPTTTGWSEVTLTEKATSVTPSKPGPAVTGINQSRSLVWAGARATVLAPDSPGYVAAGLEPGTVWPARFVPSLSRIFTAMLAVLELPLKT